MAKSLTDGLARLQSESRIPTSSWRQWCSVLKLDPVDAVEAWEGICHPIMVATGQVPEVPYILQLRAARPDLDVGEFKAEVAKVLHAIAFLYNLNDERITKGKLRSAIHGLYRRSMGGQPEGEYNPNLVRQFLFDVCAAVLVAKVLKGAAITLSGVLKPLIEGKGTIEQVSRIALKSLGSEPYADLVRDCLDRYAREARAALPQVPTRRARPAAEPEPEPELEEEAHEEVEEPSLEDIEAAEMGSSPVPAEAESDVSEALDDSDGGGAPAAAEPEPEAEPAEPESEPEPDDAPVEEPVEEDEQARDHLGECLMRFKTSLHAIYEAEAVAPEGATNEEVEQREKLLNARLKAIASFDPVNASIPTMEEARDMARRAEAVRSPSRVHKPVLGVGRPAAPAPAGPGGAVRSALIAKSLAGAPKKPAPAPAPPKPPAEGGRPTGERIAAPQAQEIDVEIRDMVEAAEITFADLDNRVRQIAKALALVESSDNATWGVFLDPGADVKDPRGYARAVSVAATPVNQAYEAIKLVAQLMNLKNLLAVAEPTVRKDRNFTLEVTTFINNVRNAGRPFNAESKQLAPVKRIIDHAAAALLRLEALRTNHTFGREHPDDYNREAVTLYYEEALRSITDQTDRDLLTRARDRADADTYALLSAFAAARYADGVVETCHQYVRQLQEQGQLSSVESFEAAAAAQPLTFEKAESQEVPAEMPPDLLAAGELGEVFDAVSGYVCTQVWAVLRPVHEPTKAIGKVKTMLRQALVGCVVLTPERKRHQEKPSIALNVANLEKVTGNPGLKDYYVRLGDDGQVQYVEGFEDGTYADLFELREYKPTRMHAAAKKKADEAGVEELQTGHKYLFTVGRTKRLFGDNPSDLINGCIRGPEGGPKVFDVF